MLIKLKGPEIMSNMKMNRNFFLAVIAVFLAVSLFGGFGGVSAQAGATPASNTAKTAKTSASAQKSNTSTSASEKKTAKTEQMPKNVKPPKLAKETFSYISAAQEVVKDGRAYKAGEDQPYTGYEWVRREDLPLQADKTKYPGDDVRIFLYYKDGKSQSGNYLRSKYVPKYSAIWETKKRQGVTTVSIYLLRDNVKTAISNDNFFELKDECFYLKFRHRTAEDGDVDRVELFDQDGTRILSAVHRKDCFTRFEVAGEDGIFRKFTMNQKTERLDGPMEAYHPNGKLFYETVYTDGDPDSIVELYDPAGKKAFRLYFETHLLKERTHTSNLILVEEWDEANHRFVDRDKEHFNMFVKFCRPTDELIPRDLEDDLKIQADILLLETLKDTTLSDVKMRDLIEEELQELLGGEKK